MRKLSRLKLLNYKRVRNHSLPAIPSKDPSWLSQFVFVGKGFRKPPELLEAYIKGGWRYSEQRKAEIHAQLFNKQPRKKLEVSEDSALVKFLKLFY